MKKIDEAVNYAKNGQVRNFFNAAKELNPMEYKKMVVLLNDIPNSEEFWDKFADELDANELHEYHVLGLSTRMSQYLLDKAKDRELTDEEFAELRACDF